MESFIELGYIGLFLCSFLASTIIPLSSDVVLSALIVLKYDPVLCVILATAGNFLGGMTSYGIGYLGKIEWLNKIKKIDKSKIDTFYIKIKKYGVFAALFAWLPFVGDLIAISLGFFKVNPTLVSILMLIGRFVRFLVITLITLSLI